MSRNNTVELIARFKDQASQGLRKLRQETAQTSQAQVRASATARQAQMQQSAMARLGIRSEQQIRREIQLTQAAYNRLARTGTASQRELARAAAATKAKIRELNGELDGGVARGGKWLQTVRGIGAGAVAGGMAAYAALKPAMDDKKQVNANINQVARQAYIEDDSKSAAWIATQGAAEIKKLAVALIRENGGNADSALGTISAMMTQGMSFEQVKQDASTVYAATMASGENGQYNPQDTAKLMKVLKDAGFEGKNLSLAFEKALQSGLDGNFEIADMVRELPALMPMAQQSGLTGMGGLEYLLAMLQSAANKAGSTSEAATNVSNLLGKSLSADTVQRLSKLKLPNGKGGEAGIDWQASVLKGKANGENAVQVLARLVDKALSSDKGYLEAKAKADNGDKAAAEQMNMMKGFVLSKIMPDLQAKQGLMAATDIEQVNGYLKSLAGVNADNGKVQRLNEARMATDAAQQEANKAIAMMEESLTEPLNGLGTKWSELTAEFPNVTLALQALAAAATAAAAAQAVLGGKGLGDLIPGKGGLPKGGAGSGVGGMLGRVGKWAGRAGPLAFGAGLLLHSDGLNKGEDERMAAMRAQYKAMQARGAAKPATPLESPALKESAAQMQQSAQTQQAASQQYAQSVAQNQTASTQITASAAQMQAASAQMTAAAAQMQAAAGKPIPVTVTVQNGNIMAYINQAAQRAAAKN